MWVLEPDQPSAWSARMRHLLRPLAVLLALSIGVSLQALADARFSDGPQGVSCHYFSVAGRLAWSQPGGDWIDAGASPHGDVAFSTATAAVRPGQLVELDVEPVLSKIDRDAADSLGLIVRYLGGGGVIAFHSRESDDALSRPRLEVRFDDGSRRQLSPVADTVLDCSTRRALGAGAAIKLSNSQNGLLEFDLQGIDLQRVTHASLQLAVQRVWSQPAGRFGVFLATLPGSRSGDSTPQPGIAAGFPGDQGIESHPAVYFVARFESGDVSQGWTQMARKSQVALVAQANDNGFSPLQGNALQVSLIPRQNLGLDLRYDFAKEVGTEPTEAYLRYYLMFGRDWRPDVDGGKLPGLAGTYNLGGWGQRRSDGTNGWSVRGAFARQAAAQTAAPQPVAIGSYAYHADAEGRSGAFWGWNLGPTGLLETGRWYAIEQYVRMNTPGRNDGVVRAWIDGKLAFERTDLRFREIDALKIETAWFNVYHGGTAKPPREMSLYIDNVVIAREYIGPFAD